MLLNIPLKILHRTEMLEPTWPTGVLDPGQLAHSYFPLPWGVYPPYPPEAVLAPEVNCQRWECLLLRPLASPGWAFGPPGPPLAAPRDPRGPLGPHLATPLDPLDSSLLGGTLRALLDNFPKIPQ